MRITNILHIASLSIILLSGCASSLGPDGYLSDPEHYQYEAFGGWAVVDYYDDKDIITLEGELLAVEDSALYVLSSDNFVSNIGRSSIKKIRISSYESNKSDAIIWTIAGTVSSASHGVIAFASAPLWLIVGIISSARQTHYSYMSYPDIKWEVMGDYSRFPQGLPDEIDLLTLKSKPYSKKAENISSIRRVRERRY